MEQESKEVAMGTSTAVGAVGTDLGFGASEGISQKDIKIDRILVSQSMSKKVQSDEIEKGIIYVQSTLEELANHKKKTDMEFIAVKAMKYWTENDKDSKEYLGRFPALSPDELPWEEQKGARTIKRTYTHSFIVLLPSKIAGMEDTPLELAFRSTNLDCARAINTILVNMRRREVPSWNKVFKLKLDTKSNDKGTWYVTVASIARDANEEEIQSARAWSKILSDASVNLAEEEVNDTPKQNYNAESDDY